MVSKETIQIIESVYNNFREDRLQNVNENLTLCLHSNEKFFKDRIKRNYKHANNLRKLYIKGLRDKNYNKDNKDTTSIIRVVYKEFSTANIILEDLRRIKDFFPNDLVSVYLVSTNDVTDCCDTHRKIENKIKSIIGGGKSLHLNINEISINHDSENAKNISEILRKNTEKNAIFNILIMIKHEVRYLSDFFALLSFKQYSKRPDSYVSKQYGKLKDDEPNNFKYCMNVIFKKHSFGTLPRFNTELKFPIRFYSINSNEDKLGSSSPMMDNVSVVSNDTLIPDVNEINEGNSGLLSPSIQSEATIVCSESDDVNKMNTDLDLESCMNIIDNIDSFQFSSLQNENQSIINESNDMKAILPNTDLPTVFGKIAFISLDSLIID